MIIDDKLRRRLLKVQRFIEFGESLCDLSQCRRMPQACVVFPSDCSEVLAVGYNGPPRGCRADHCRGPDAVGTCGCVHAEANALQRMRASSRPVFLWCQTAPCEHCAGLIINSQAVSLVLYANKYRDATGFDLLSRRVPVLESEHLNAILRAHELDATAHEPLLRSLDTIAAIGGL